MSTTRSNSIRARRREGEHGVVLVEFAFVLPLLLLLVFGIVDFGRALNYSIQQTHLSNEGARWAVVNTWPGCPLTQVDLCTTPTLQQYLRSRVASGELQSGTKVCISDAPNPGDPVTVTVSAPFNWFGFFTGFGTISSKATMRMEVFRTHYQAVCDPADPPATPPPPPPPPT